MLTIFIYFIDADLELLEPLKVGVIREFSVVCIV